MKVKDTFALFAWEVLNPIALRMNKQTQYNFNERYSGINLGCGLDNPSNWLGIDGGVYPLLRNTPGPILKRIYKYSSLKKAYALEDFIKRMRETPLLHHDLACGIPFDDNTIPAIYSSHFFEHLTKADSEALLKECFRVLKPRGTIRVVVPLLETEVKKIKEAIALYDGGDSTQIQKYVTCDNAGFVNAYNNHRSMYDFQDMHAALSRAGFVEIECCSFGEGNLPDVKKMDTRGGLFVEGRKSA
jgi:predicted SAM-dependent methyltransferase